MTVAPTLLFSLVHHTETVDIAPDPEIGTPGIETSVILPIHTADEGTAVAASRDHAMKMADTFAFGQDQTSRMTARL
jgi:hypothetical protein